MVWTFDTTKARPRVPRMTGVLLAMGFLPALFGAALGIETHSAAPARAAIHSAPDRPPRPADPPVTVTTVVTQPSITTVTESSPTTVTTTSLTTVATTVFTTVTSTVPGPATSTAYSRGAGYHYQSGQCVGNGPVVN